MNKDQEAAAQDAAGHGRRSTQAAGFERRERASSRGPADPRAEKRGFDPYNSGVFDRGRAWSRIGKR
jgi:hypothetical protein